MDIKDEVRKRYAQAASENASCCGDGSAAGCGCNPASNEISSIMVDSYRDLAGHEREADLALGCGIPTRFADLKEGNTVVDLGSGAGNDAFVAREAVGAGGEVIGLDMTDEMLARARGIAERRGFRNVSFVKGDIEQMPLADGTADVVLSNCTLNLVPDKQSAFSEMFRITRKGGHFCISDVVTEGVLPEDIRGSVEAYTGCIAGALEREHYLELLRNAGFEDIAVREEHEVPLPGAIAGTLREAGDVRVLSITVTGTRTR